MEERVLSVAPSIVDPSPRTRPRPTREGLGLEHVYAPSDDGIDENLLIFLHGLGDTLAPFARLAKQLQLPQTATLILQAPDLIPFLEEGEEMYQWYTSFTQLGELIEHPNPLRGVQVVHRALEHLTSPTCGWPADRIHLFGFAQGGSVALESALRRPGGIKSVVSVGGGLVEVPTRAGPGAGTKVLYVGSSAGETGLSKGFSSVRVERMGGTEVRMPKGKDEWGVIMRFWSEVLERRGPEGEGIHRVLIGGRAARPLLALSRTGASRPHVVDHRGFVCGYCLGLEHGNALPCPDAEQASPHTLAPDHLHTAADTACLPPLDRQPFAFNRRSLAVIDERTSPRPTSPPQIPPPPPLSTYARIFARFRRHAPADHVPPTTTAQPTESKRPQPAAGPSTGPAIKPRKTLKKRGSQPISSTTAEPPPKPRTTSPVPRTASPLPAQRPKSPPPTPAPIPVPSPAPVPAPPPPPRRGRPRTGTVVSPTPTPKSTEMYRSQSPQPTKQSLKSWWKQFKLAQVPHKKDQDDLKNESLRYASVQISTADPNGELYVWGYIPVVVAKCGLFLKENATEVEGVFRINGSNRRMRELQTLFESPPRYGKDLNWKNESYTSHDVASVFRRYLTQMPEPVIPTEQYHSFRAALAKQPRDVSEIISTYRRLIKEMPRANQYLLLYVLDLLSVFARKADKNLMTESNLAVIFRPGIISHPAHEMQPQEHALSQEVLVFLIQHQDHFMLDPPTRHDSIMVSSNNSAGFSPGIERQGFIVPSDSDEEPPAGGWKLVERKNVNPAANLGRRRSLNSPVPVPVFTAEPESTVTTVDLPVGGASVGGGNVKRSRTLPTQRTTGDAGEVKAGEGKTKRRTKRLDTVGSVGSAAEAAGVLRQPTQDREKVKERREVMNLDTRRLRPPVRPRKKPGSSEWL
ncbi:Rho-GTPase-activating protein [Ceratobasidium sp. AG-Ba]|nr:Rho-GTPase-activating protein [Ceratobasidium sp. AG-Ba]